MNQAAAEGGIFHFHDVYRLFSPLLDFPVGLVCIVCGSHAQVGRRSARS